MQVVGLGTQDDFALAQDFIDAGGLETPEMLYDPTFATWQSFGVRANSQMIVLSPDLEQGSNLIYGFDQNQREAILQLVAEV